MKRILAIVAVAVLALALAGCASQSASRSTSSSAMSASDTQVSSASASSASSQAVSWTKANTAEEAAKGASISSFAVPNRTVIADITFTSPAFAYTEHVAEAAYEDSSATLTVRKAEGAHTAPVTVHDKSEFSKNWKSTYEGYEVVCYGNEQGAASIILWNDGTKEYGASIEGADGEKVTMDAEDVDDIVKAVKNAESGSASSSSSASASSSASGGSPLSKTEVEKIVKNNGYGEVVSMQQLQLNDGQWYWQVITRGSNGVESTWVVDPKGNINNVDVDTHTTTVPNVIGMDAKDAALAIYGAGLSPDGMASGTVTDQSPSGGTRAEVGETVSITTDGPEDYNTDPSANSNNSSSSSEKTQ